MNNIHGSLVLAGVGNRWNEVIAADSRVIIRSPDGQTSLGYFDGFPKIQLLKKDKYPISTVGSTLIGGHFINTIVYDFNMAGIEDLDLIETLLLKDSEITCLASCQILLINSLVVHMLITMPKCIFSLVKIFSLTLSELRVVKQIYRHTSKNFDGLTLSSEELGHIFEEIIYQYAEDKNKEFGELIQLAQSLS